MKGAERPRHEAQHPALVVEINRICDQFESDWQAGRRPAIEDHLAGTAEPLRSALLRELLEVELEFRVTSGEQPGAAEFHARFPSNGTEVNAALRRAGINPHAASEGKRSAPGAGRNLLFGLLALQNDFIDRDALLAAFATWVADKSRPLGQILRDRGALDGPRHILLEALVAEHLRRHGGDPEKSLASLPVGSSTRESLRAIRDSDLEASIARGRTRRGPGFPENDHVRGRPEHGR
jgi:hypothetical protein